MLYLIIAGLLANVDLIVFFFEIPYQVIDMGGTQTLISSLSMIHAVVYVISTGVSGSRIKSSGNLLGSIRILLLALGAIYTAACFVPRSSWLILLVALHGVLVGVFWSVFWLAFYQKAEERVFSVGTEMIVTTISAVFGPIIAGILYRWFGKYILLVFSALMLIILLPWNKEVTGRSSGTAGRLRGHDPDYEPNAGFDRRNAVILVTLLWLGIALSGYLEGLFRSVMAVYLLNRGMGSEIWGTLQSIKLTAQILMIAVVQRIGENRFAFRRTKFSMLAGIGGLLAGAYLITVSGSFPLLAGSMLLLGCGYGILHFLCMHIGSALSSVLGRNLNALAESITGAGILIGSAAAGFFGGDPFRVFSVLLIGGGILIFLLYRKNIYSLKQR